MCPATGTSARTAESVSLYSPRLNRLIEALLHARLETLTAARDLLDDPDAQTLQRVALEAGLRGLRRGRPAVIERRGIERVVTRDHVMQQCRIQHVPRDRAHLVE